ncbi:MAG: hypothetical protein M3R61_13125 [Chloroflexota bacterium]|nr:hypothetical protein [Chloroflexota bacterium]
MRGPDIQYRCTSCGQISLRNDLPRNAWGDPACLACSSLQIERHRTRAETVYAWFFTFRVF